jgi:phosphoribosylglycinamide formyltransferase 1
MRILTPAFVEHYDGRLLNIHPSLLPLFPGLHTHQQALDAGEKVHGATVHFVTAELDHGPVVAQARVDVLPGDTEGRHRRDPVRTRAGAGTQALPACDPPVH